MFNFAFKICTFVLRKQQYGEKLTLDMFKHAKRNYTKNFMDNNMTEWFDSIIDHEPYIEWGNKYAPSVLGITAGAGVLKTISDTDNNNNN
ncbi:MAG: hypothetical protein LBV31_02410 [Prevotellaceae bacterium]|jgi:hypothetical protein|nr:hypothetical protein [Prevotellaceae bacterium]